MGPDFELLSRRREVNRSSNASIVNLVPDTQVVDSNITALLVNTNVIWRLLLVLIKTDFVTRTLLSTFHFVIHIRSRNFTKFFDYLFLSLFQYLLFISQLVSMLRTQACLGFNMFFTSNSLHEGLKLFLENLGLSYFNKASDSAVFSLDSIQIFRAEFLVSVRVVVAQIMKTLEVR